MMARRVPRALLSGAIQPALGDKNVAYDQAAVDSKLLSVQRMATCRSSALADRATVSPITPGQPYAVINRTPEAEPMAAPR